MEKINLNGWKLNANILDFGGNFSAATAEAQKFFGDGFEMRRTRINEAEISRDFQFFDFDGGERAEFDFAA